MLVKLFGILLLIAGGALALSVVVMLIGTLLGVLWFAVKLAVPLLLVYTGYRFLTRDRRMTAY